MYLKSLKLWNFRKFGSSNSLLEEKDGEKRLREPDLAIEFNKGLSVLIGENDSGKTAIIDAVKILLKTHAPEWIRLAEDDFSKGMDNLRIECEFHQLGNAASHFIEWLGFNEQNQPFLKVHIQARKNDEKVFFYDIKAGVDAVGHSLSSEAREYLRAVYLKPLRDAKRELIPKKNSRLSQILQGHDSFKETKEDRHELVKLFNAVEKKVNDYFLNEDGKIPKGAIDKVLSNFLMENKQSKFSITNKDEIKAVLEILKLSLEDEMMGLGSHNLLFMAAELLNLNRKNFDGIRLGLIEELEAHLHPQAQMRVIEHLQKQSHENNIQFILTSHSPNIGSKLGLHELFICEKQNVFSLKEGTTELDPNDYKFLERFLDVTKANLFFANGVILVEGWSEEILIPTIAEKIGINLTQRGVSIINVAGTAFLRYAKIFQRKKKPYMEVPVSIVTDSDIYPGMQKSKPEKYQKQMSSNNKVKGYAEQKVEVFMSRDEDWTLEWALYNSPHTKELFEQAVRSAHSGTREFESEDSVFKEKLKSKLLDKSLDKVRIANELSVILQKVCWVGEESDELTYILDAIRYAAGEKAIVHD
jgi:putative ATP-dependent endonuclease of OLD family